MSSPNRRMTGRPPKFEAETDTPDRHDDRGDDHSHGHRHDHRHREE
jgi:hypothetical protein